MGAAVAAGVHAALGGVFDARVEHTRVPAVDVHADAALRPGRQAALDLRPGRAAVGRLPHAAARATAVHAPLRAPALVGGGVEHLVVGGIHHQLGGAGFVVHVQRALPRETAVGGLVDAALAARRPQIAEGRHVHDVEVDGIDQDARDLLRRAQTHVLPRAAAVGTLVDAVAPRRRLTVVVLPGAGPDEVRVRRCDGDVTHRRRALVVEHRREGDAVVRRLVDAAGRRGHVEGRRLALEHCEVVDAAGRRTRPDLAERQPVERSAAPRLFRHRRRACWRRLRRKHGGERKEADCGER